MSSTESSARGRFFVLDGVDGCGKSTQATRLVELLSRETGRNVRHLREPGSTRVGEALRAILLGREMAPTPAVETLLFAAARAQMLSEIVAPALVRGEHVVCERFHPSTFAYQATAGEIDEDRVLALLGDWAGEPAPDLVILLEIAPEIAVLRRGRASDRIEDKGLAFQRAVAAGYARYAELAPHGVRVAKIDAAQSVDVVAARIWREVSHALR